MYSGAVAPTAAAAVRVVCVELMYLVSSTPHNSVVYQHAVVASPARERDCRLPDH